MTSDLGSAYGRARGASEANAATAAEAAAVEMIDNIFSAAVLMATPVTRDFSCCLLYARTYCFWFGCLGGTKYALVFVVVQLDVCFVDPGSFFTVEIV